MIKSAKNILIFGLATLATQGSAAADSSSNSMFGLPSSATSPSEVVGALPYSNQWISEKIGSYLYLSYNSVQMANPSLTVGQYVSNFGSQNYAYPTVDYFSRLISFAGAESRSFLRDFALWGRYSLGFADRTGHLSSTQTTLNSSLEGVSMLIFSTRIGALVAYDKLNWFKPYAGMEVDPFLYRNTSDISGAEQQGGNFTYGPLVGAHFPVLFSGRASILAEYRRSIALPGSGQLYANSNNYTAGMGMSF